MGELTPNDETIDARPPVGDTTADTGGSDAVTEAPKTIGGYRIKGVLGRGGMGVVYLANSRSLDRDVALKALLQGEFASARAQERFQIEARLAARLRHPNIVGIHEVGVDGGRSFLVMDRIDGQSLSQLLATEGRLDATRAVYIAERVARALYYAHSRAVLHRDVKPGNILLTEDGEPVLTDFGLAKDVRGDSSQASPTVSGQAIGTPAYMAPEQARGERDRVDRRADVYALGATLYEMLTGRPPYEGSSALEILEKVSTLEPTNPRRLVPTLERDPAVICMKCLEKEPEQRYGSALELAEDLKRVLDHLPIAARAPTAFGRLRRWFRRNERFTRGASVAGSIAAVVLLVLTAGFVIRLSQARDELTHALDDAQLANAGAARAAAEAKRQAAKAEKRARIARESLRVLVVEVRAQLEDVPGERARIARRRLLKQAQSGLEAIRDAESAEDLADLSMETLFELGDLQLLSNEIEKARASYQAIWEEAGKALEKDPESRATRILRMRAQFKLADVAWESGDLNAAEELLRGCLDLGGELAVAAGGEEPASANAATVMVRLGEVVHAQGRDEEAGALYARALTLHRERLARGGETVNRLRNVSTCLNQIGILHRQRGEIDDAIRSFRECLANDRRILEKTPGSAISRREVSASLGNLTRSLHEKGALDKAQLSAEEALAIARTLLEEDPRSSAVRGNFAARIADLTAVLGSRGRFGEAETLLREGCEVTRGLMKDAPDRLGGVRAYEAMLANLGKVLVASGQLEEGRRVIEESLALGRRMVSIQPSSIEARSGLAISLRDAGHVYELLGLLGKCEASYTESVEISRETTRLAPTLDTQRSLGNALARLGETKQFVGKFGEAKELYVEAERVWRAVCAENPKHPAGRRGLAVALNGLATSLLRDGQLDESRAAIEEAVGLTRALAAESPTDQSFRVSLAVSLQILGHIHVQRRDPELAVAALEASIASDRESLTLSPRAPRVLDNLSGSYYYLALAQQLRGDLAQSIAACEQGLDVLAGLPPTTPGYEAKKRGLTGVRAHLVRLRDLMSGAQPPNMPQDHLVLAYLRYDQKRYAESAAEFALALEDASIRGDLGRGNLYNGACAAALAGASDPSKADAFTSQALSWLSEDLRRRRVESLGAARDPSRKDAVEAALARHMEHARVKDPDLAALRGRPEFDALFRGK